MLLPNGARFGIFRQQKYHSVVEFTAYDTRADWEAGILECVKHEDRFEAVELSYATVKTSISLPSDSRYVELSPGVLVQPAPPELQF